ncbi:hypothetical protein [Deinococcus sonorensis]|uniref:Uncharacterized protein n=2 Tax=Deinococcus sonorensis TaxID=309891 RepID=A0AAU7U6V9_9DEIO
MATNKTILSRHYVLTTRGVRHDLTASNAADLASQVREHTKSRAAEQISRIAWGDRDARIDAAGMSLVAVGQTVKEVWRQVSPIRGSESALAAPEEPALSVTQASSAAPAGEAQRRADTARAVPVPALEPAHTSLQRREEVPALDEIEGSDSEPQD